MTNGRLKVKIFDWYASADEIMYNNPACVLHVSSDGILTPSQVSKIKRTCPNWTRQVEAVHCDPIGNWTYRVITDTENI